MIRVFCCSCRKETYPTDRFESACCERPLLNEYGSYITAEEIADRPTVEQVRKVAGPSYHWWNHFGPKGW